jgi:hypothetical protein
VGREYRPKLGGPSVFPPLPERLTYRFQGREFRLTDVSGRVVEKLLA